MNSELHDRNLNSTPIESHYSTNDSTIKPTHVNEDEAKHSSFSVNSTTKQSNLPEIETGWYEDPNSIVVRTNNAAQGSIIYNRFGPSINFNLRLKVTRKIFPVDEYLKYVEIQAAFIATYNAIANINSKKEIASENDKIDASQQFYRVLKERFENTIDRLRGVYPVPKPSRPLLPFDPDKEHNPYKLLLQNEKYIV